MVPAITITGDRAQPDAGFFGAGGGLVAGAAPGLVAGVAPALNGADAEADEEPASASAPAPSSFEQKLNTSDGETYEIVVTYGADALIPDDAHLEAHEILPGDGDYDYDAYYQEAAEIASNDAESRGIDAPMITSARLFDIEILGAEGKIEPAAPVQVNIRLVDGEAPDVLSVVHFAEGGAEAMQLKEAPANREVESALGETANEVDFETESFSVYTVVNVSDFASIANNGPYALVSSYRGPNIGSADQGNPSSVSNYAMTDSMNGSTLSGKGVNLNSNTVGGDVTEWNFEAVGDGSYRIYVGSGEDKKYIRSNYTNLYLDADQHSADKYIPEVSNGKVRFKLSTYASYYITNTGNNPSKYELTMQTDNGTWFTLAKVDPNYEEQTAKKVSAQDWKASEVNSGRGSE